MTRMQNWWRQFNRSEFCSKLVWNFCGSISRTSEKTQWDFLSVLAKLNPIWEKNHVKSVGIFLLLFDAKIWKCHGSHHHYPCWPQCSKSARAVKTGPESSLFTQKIMLDRSFTFCKTVCIYVRIFSSDWICFSKLVFSFFVAFLTTASINKYLANWEKFWDKNHFTK